MDIKSMTELEQSQTVGGDSNVEILTAMQASPQLATAMTALNLGKNAVELYKNTFHHVKGSLASTNFVKFNMKPYGITLVKCSANDELRLANYFNYYGCPSARIEALQFSKYNYKDHGFVKGDLHYKDTLNMSHFHEIQQIFRKGVHILYK